MSQRFGRFAGWVAWIAGTPQAFVVTVVLILVWLVSGPFLGWSDTWQLVANTATTLVTTLLVLLVQHTQNRDTRTLHLKLDELLTALKEPDSAYAGIEQADDRTLDRLERLLEQQRGRTP